MEKGVIAKRLIIASIVYCYGGIVLILIGVAVLLALGDDAGWYRFLTVLPGIVALFYGSYVMTRKCRCPYCGIGDSDRTRHGNYHSMLSIKSIRAGQFVCPRCMNTIYLV
jgi:hypothetical protein